MQLKKLTKKSIDELEKSIDKSKLLLNNSDGHDLIYKFDALYKRLKDLDKADQENFYLTYLALLFLWEDIEKSKLYKKDPNFVGLMIKKEWVNEVNENYNKLRKSLIERYSQEKLIPFETFSLNDHNNESLANREDKITCKELYDLIKQLSSSKKSNLLLIDLRRKDDFHKSSINFTEDKYASILTTINIPEDKIRGGCTCVDIEKILNPNELILFRNRNQAHSVILMDYESNSFNSSDRLFIFYQALTKFDTTSNRLQKQPQLLGGGFQDWLLTYPMYCTDSSATFSGRSNNNHQFENQTIEPSKYNFSSLNANDGDVVERIYSKSKENGPSIPGSAQFIRPSSESNNGLFRNSSLANSFTNNLTNDFTSRTNFRADENSTFSQSLNDKNKVIYHKIHIESNEDEDDDDNQLSGQLNERNFPAPPAPSYFSKPISEFKKNEATHSDFSNSYDEAPSIFSNSFGRRSKSYTNLTEPLSPDEEESNNESSLFSNKPSFDRKSKPPSLLNDITNRQPSLSTSKYREFSRIYSSASYPTGLKNLGNTCFMNAVIQCLFNVKHFSKYFIDETYRKDINHNSKFGTRGELTEEFGVLMAELNNPQLKHISPKDFRRAVGKHIPMYSGCEQQDSHEFLLILFEKLHADLNKPPSIKTITEIPDTMPQEEAIERFWNDNLANNDSIISRLFEGLIMSTLECKTCKKNSNTFEVFTCLSLPIPTNLSSTRCELTDCLKEFTRNELMCDEAMWQCPNCKVKRPADKKTKIVKPPKVLIIHLKRFSFEGRWKQKITSFVDFPMHNFNMRHYIYVTVTYSSNEPLNTNYDLIGVVDHTGSLEGGHYTAICKSERNNKWNKYDDQDVYEISESEVVSSKSYLLFYVLTD